MCFYITLIHYCKRARAVALCEIYVLQQILSSNNNNNYNKYYNNYYSFIFHQYRIHVLCLYYMISLKWSRAAE